MISFLSLFVGFVFGFCSCTMLDDWLRKRKEKKNE